MKRIYSTFSKIVFSFSFVVLMHFGSYATLSGNYTINPSLAASNTNYQNWASAIGDLRTGIRTDGGTAQGPGVSAAVVFTAKDQVYTNTQFTITAISGASSTNTITFKSTSDSSLCVLQYPSGVSSIDDWVVRLSGAKYITFYKMGFQRTGSNTYYTVFQDSATSNITINRCWLKTRKLPSTTTLGFARGIGCQFWFTGRGDTTLINQCRLIYGYTGMYTTTASTGVTISNNIFDTLGCAGVYMGSQTNFKITGNTFAMGDFGTGQGHYVSYAIRSEGSPSIIITKNKIFMLATNAGTVRTVVLANASTAAAPALINNNFFVITGGTTAVSGISLYGNDYVDIYYNNFYITSSLASGSVIHENVAYTNSHIRIKNNNIVHKGGGLMYDLQSANNTGFDSLNYNNFLTNGAIFAKWTGGVTYSSLAAWFTARRYDSNSINVDPGYVSPSNLHTSNIGIFRKGTPYWRVSDDIDGEVRHATKPVIGADEFFPAQNDAGITTLDSPLVFCAGTKNVKVSFNNYGYDTLKSVAIQWSLNGVAKTTYNWSGAIAPGGSSSSVTLGSFAFLPNTAYTFKIWTANPNAASDGNRTNDTLKVTRYAGMSGTYTIGDTIIADFRVFNHAITALTERGICGPVTFNIYNGTYTEQLTLVQLPGMGSSNPVTFQSISRDSSKVIIRQPSSISTGNNNATIQLNGCSYVTFRGVTFQRTGTSSITEVLHILNGANNNTFTNCQMINTKITYANTTGTNIWSDQTADNNNVFLNNYVKFGYFCMLYQGTSSAIHESGTVIQGNVFDSAYTSAVQISYNDKIVIKGNTFRNTISATAGNFDLALVDCDSANSVTGNYFYDSNTSISLTLTTGCAATVAKPGLIANNFIIKPNGTGISIDGADNYNVVFNNIYIRRNTSTNAGIYTTATASTNLVLKNNNIVMEGGYVLNITTGTQVSASNRNNLFAKGAQFALWGGTPYTTLASLKAASTMDVNSISIDPLFVTPSNLHVTNFSLNGAGEPITGVTTDIDDQIRNVTTPDIGADEFGDLNGAFTINPKLPASVINYQNWASAVSDLLSGSRTDGGPIQGPGIKGAVTFKVYDTIYTNTQVLLTAITGASPTNTVTFVSTTDSSKCVLQYPSGVAATDDWVVQLNGAKYVTFKKIGFQRTGTNAYYTVIQMLGAAKRNTISNCWFKTRRLPSNSGTGFTTGIGAHIYFSGQADTILITKNYMEYGYNGLFASTTSTGNTISNNVFDTVGCAGMYLLSQNKLIVTGNIFNMGDYGATAGHYVSYAIRVSNSPSVVISKNKVFMLATNAATVRAVIVDGTTSPSTAPAQVVNNFIVNYGGTGSCTGMAMYGVKYLDFMYNNVLITSALLTGSAFYLYAPSQGIDSFVRVQNNNMVNKGAGYVYDLPGVNGYSVTTSNYNNCLALGSNFSRWEGVNYATFAALKAVNSKDANSVSIDPGYTSNTNLHVSNIAINGKATPLTTVTDDIDGEIRNATTPDIGADEFFPIANDAGIVSVDSPQTFCAGLKNVKVRFQNYGFDTLKNVQINWAINGITQIANNWSGTVAPGASSSMVQLTNFLFAPNTAYIIKVWTKNPNGGTDGNRNNDTVLVTRYAGMSGAYTISNSTAANYTSFNLAISAMGLRGICGPVTFNVTPGTYTEQFLVPSLVGMGAANPIIFQSTSNDSTLVVVKLPSSSSTGINNASVQLNASSYVTFNKITFQRTGTNPIGAVVHILNGANHITFTNCQMIGITYPSASIQTYNIFSDGGVNNYNSFLNNYIKLGSMSMMYSGLYATHQTGTVVQGNVFDSAYNSAVQLTYNDNVIVKGNTFRTIRTPVTGNFDMGLFDCDNAINVTGNYFYDTNTAFAIGLSRGCTATLSNPGLISNNFIAKTTGTGIFMDTASYQNVVFNSIYLRRNVSTNNGILLNNAMANNIVLKNNNIVMEGGYVFNTTGTQVSASNRNNLYAKGAQFAIWAGTPYTTLANLKVASTMDVNSMSVDPLFISPTNLHVTNNALNNAGEPITGVTTDIDGQIRNATTPDIGADEFGVNGLIGAYTINPKLPAAARNYRNWASAVGDMLTGIRTDGGPAQGDGIVGAVTFTVYDSVYANTQVLLTAIKGASPINTVTFVSTSDSSRCVLQYPSGSTAADDYALMLNGAKYVTFKKIGFQRTGVNSKSTVIQIKGSSNNNNISNCWIKGRRVPSNLTSGFSYGIGSCIYFTGNGDSNTFSKNWMMYGYNGIYDSIIGTANKITANKIDTAGSSGVFMGNQTNLLISGNTINMGDFGVGSNQYTSYAIRVEVSPGVIISKNKCILSAVNCQISRAIIVYNTASTAAQPALINNNFVVNSGGTTSCTGLNVYGAAYSQWFYNNVLILNSVVTNGSALFVNASFTGSPVEIGNNNLINKGGTLVYDVGTNYTDLDTVNYNNCFTTGTTFGNWNATPVTAFPAWKTTSGKDANSVNVDPGYISNTNLHVTHNAVNNNKGRFYYRVKDDIDGDIRSLTTPDIGADEFRLTNEAGITAIPSPVNNACQGTYAVKAVLKNFGEDTLKKTTLTWSINGVFKTPLNWTGNVLPQQFDTVTVGSFAFAGGNATIMVRSTLPNGNPDVNPSNDSFKVIRTIRALPVANAGVDQNVCLGDSILLGPPGSSSFTYRWLDVSHNVVATTSQFKIKPSSTITLYYEVTDKTYLCVNKDTLKVSTITKPVANAGSDLTVCLGDSIMVGSAPSATLSYKWMDVSHNVLATTSQFYFIPGSLTTLYLEVTNIISLCSNTDTLIIKTNPKPLPNAGSDQAICLGGSAMIGSALQVGYSYSWTSLPVGFTSTFSDPTVLPTGNTIYIVKKTNDITGCYAFDSVNVTIALLIKPQIVGDTTVCKDNTVNYNTIFNTGNTYLWRVTGGNIINGQGTNTVDINWPVLGNGTVEIVETNASKCKDSSSVNVIISQNPKAKMSVVISCKGSLSGFIDSSSAVVSRIWDFGDGQTATSVDTTHTYANAGTYNVKLTVFNSLGCVDSIVQPFIVKAPPKADFDIDALTCVGETITITNNSTDASSYFWDLGNTQTSTLANPSYSYSAAGIYNVKLLAFGAGCKDSMDKVVTVNPSPVAKFSSKQQTGKTIQFTDSSSITTGTIASWKWKFGDGDSSILQNPSHLYLTANSYSITFCVTSAAGCENCITKSITVVSIDQAGFDKSLTLYPNPSDGRFTVKSTNQLDLIEVTNVLGKVVEVVKPLNNSVTIDISTQPFGVYFLKLSSENQSTVVRITKQ